MPIYGYGLMGGDPWVLCKKMELGRLLKLIEIFRDELHEQFKLDSVFINSIQVNTNPQKCFIADFDISKTNINIYTYQKNMEKVIMACNKILIDEKSLKLKIANKKIKYDFSNYKFDIMGSWTTGKVIIMQKK